MRVLLVANDKAPASAFVKVAAELVGRGYEVYDAHCYDCKPDVVCLGMSSSVNLAAREIWAANLAREQGIPYGFYCDTWGVHNRPWFEHLREDASFLFAINEEEAEAARKLFPNARVVVSGNPFWEGFFNPKLTREEVREKLKVADNEYMLLCPGGKDLAVNMLHFGGVVEAVNVLAAPNYNHWKVFIALHPGDKNGVRAYQGLRDWSKTPVEIITVEHDAMTGSDMIPGCDVMIESASTMGIEAACQRKPVINYFSAIALERLKETTGSDKWPLCEKGCACVVRGNPHELANYIDALVRYDGARLLMQKRQAEVFPPPSGDSGDAVQIMANTLREFAR